MATKKTTGKSSSRSKRRTSSRKSSSKAALEKKRQSTNLIGGTITFVLGLLLLFMALIPGENAWLFLHNTLFGLFGVGGYVLPVLLCICGLIAVLRKEIVKLANKLWQALLVLILFSSAVQVIFVGQFAQGNLGDVLSRLWQDGVQLTGGGVFSVLLGWPLLTAFGQVGASIFLVLVGLLVLLLLTGRSLLDVINTFRQPDDEAAQQYQEAQEELREQKRQLRQQQRQIRREEKLQKKRRQIDIALTEADHQRLQQQKSAEDTENPMLKKPIHQAPIPKVTNNRFDFRQVEDISETTPPAEQKTEKKSASRPASANPPAPEEEQPQDAQLNELVKKAIPQPVQPDLSGDTLRETAPAQKPEPDEVQDVMGVLDVAHQEEAKPVKAYQYPPTTLLNPPQDHGNRDLSIELRGNAELLVDTLKSFGVQTRVVDISRGPTVTRYELQPSAGVKISKITGLADDIALNLASAGVRIEAPIPNKAAVGIEVPNKETEIVTMREIIDTKMFREAKSKLTVALGRDISGHEVCFDIAKMPHMLIAGATGSGKSVCINAILMSLLYKASPSEVKLLLVDPKVVELGVYNGIPHLLVPVVTDPRKAAGALGWAVTEMLNRYKLFADSSVRDIKGYNEMAAQQSLELLPEIVIIIDELADLMMAAPNEVEDAICRLAQMARAAGMHLIIATQRPSVDVITGVIKANIPSRIAFSVSSQVDSRTIIDSGGAEKLLGKGDMLFFPMGMPKPTRLQCCFVSDKEVEAVVDYIKHSGESAEYDDAILDEIDRQAEASANKKGKKSEEDVEGGDEVDPLLDKAIEVVIESGQASTSYLQRRLKVGYSRAARIIDQMEQKGVIGPFEGSKPRAVLMTRAQYLEMTLQPDHIASGDTTE